MSCQSYSHTVLKQPRAGNEQSTCACARRQCGDVGPRSTCTPLVRDSLPKTPAKEMHLPSVTLSYCKQMKGIESNGRWGSSRISKLTPMEWSEEQYYGLGSPASNEQYNSYTPKNFCAIDSNHVQLRWTHKFHPSDREVMRLLRPVYAYKTLLKKKSDFKLTIYWTKLKFNLILKMLHVPFLKWFHFI